MPTSSYGWKGWIDYNLPQLYWEIGHDRADYTTLLRWWNDNFGQPLYIGQDLERSMKRNELDVKIRQSREMPFVQGNCYWYGYRSWRIPEVADQQEGAHRAKALIPPYAHLPRAPGKVKRLAQVFTEDMHFLTGKRGKIKQS